MGEREHKDQRLRVIEHHFNELLEREELVSSYLWDFALQQIWRKIFPLPIRVFIPTRPALEGAQPNPRNPSGVLERVRAGPKFSSASSCHTGLF